MRLALVAYTRLVLTATLLVAYYGIYAVRVPLRRHRAPHARRKREGR